MIVKTDGAFVFYCGSAHPSEGTIVIAYKDEDQREQCEYRNGRYYVWRYGITEEVYATDETVYMWRGCTGFDF